VEEEAEPRMRAPAILFFISLALGAAAQTQRPADQPSTPPGNKATAGSATLTGPMDRKQAWSYDPDAGVVYQRGDFRWMSWGYGEHVFRPDGDGFWRRVRQGMEFDLPRFAPHYRTALVYEVDFTDTNFFRDRSKLNIVENLYVAIQDADDPSKLRVLFGENTHILSREDNLSSGNLPTINRSLILEEHGSVHSYGTQFGVELVKAVTPRYTIAFSALDNRGSLNTTNPRYGVGNDLAVKVSGSLIDDDKHGRKLYAGVSLDQTRDIRDGSWTFISAVAGQAIGTAPASGNKATGEIEAVYTDRIGNHNYSLESEHLLSLFSKTNTHIPGGYALGQFSLFHTARVGDLDPFVRYDWVRLSADGLRTPILQQAVRAGFNWNLPWSRERVNFHMEYARNSISGPPSSIPSGSPLNELGLELRFNATRYVRY
jgi:hypothetical protein